MEKKSHLYRIRIMFDEDGTPNFVETVVKNRAVDGDEVHELAETVKTYDVTLVDRDALAKLLANLGLGAPAADAKPVRRRKKA